MKIPEKWRLFLNDLLRGGPEIRLMQPEDVSQVVRIIRLHDSDDAKAAQAYFAMPGIFERPYEEGCHLVLIDPAESRIVGVSGFGRDPSPETEGVFWLGWTYVNPYFRGQGHGARLLHVVVEQLRRLGGRKLYVETSSLKKFATAVNVYLRTGFVEEGRLRDFYRQGEDKLIFGMSL